MPERPNFYLLLELDPSVDDWSVIEQRILEQKRVWSRDRSMGNPKARRRAESSLALVQEIESVLKDPETRRQEAKEALREQQKARQEQMREFDQAIAVLKTGDFCGEDQINRLAQRFAGTFSADEIRKHLQAAGVPIEGGPGTSRKTRPVKEQIDKVTASNIRQNLDQLGYSTLYEFLDLKPQSSPQALCDRAEEIYRENQRLGRTDAEASARNALTGICRSLFQSDREKAKYDNYLAIAAMEGLKHNIELAASDGFLTRKELDTLVQQAQERGVSADDARAFIEAYAAGRKWGVQSDGSDLPSEALKLCGFCSTLASADASRCVNCGEPLEMDCPRCGAKTPTRNAACASCGCRTGDAPLIQGLLKEGERLTLEGEFVAALRSFDKALLYWPDWRPAVESRRRAEEKRSAREAELAAIETFLLERRLLAAGSALERFRRDHGAAGLEDLERRAREGIARAEATFQQGEQRRRAGDYEGALDRYDEALSICADFEPVHRILAANPSLRIAEVDDLEAMAGDGEMILRWSPPPGCRAVEVWRQNGAPPERAGFGSAVVVAGNSVHDAGLVNGQIYGYRIVAVFPDPARPGGERRTAGRTIVATPISPPRPVLDLRASRNGKVVLLSWTPVEGASVQIRQTPRAPEHAPGLILPASQADRFGSLVPNSSANGAQVTLSGQGRTFFIPLSVSKTTAVAGRAVEVTSLDPVRRLSARRSGSTSLVLTWDWPSGTDEVTVAWAHDRHPEDPSQGNGGRARVTHREYDRTGCWMLPHAERRPHYFSVFAKASDADLWAPAARVVESMGQGLNVSYQVVVKKALLRRTIEEAWIELTCGNGDGTELPALVIVGKAHAVPLSPKDGEVLAETPSLRFDQGRARLPIPERCWSGRPYVKLFFRDAEAAREIRLLPAEKERLRLA